MKKSEQESQGISTGQFPILRGNNELSYGQPCKTQIADKIDDSKYFSMRKESFSFIDAHNSQFNNSLYLPSYHPDQYLINNNNNMNIPINNTFNRPQNNNNMMQTENPINSNQNIGDWNNLNPSPIFVFPENHETKLPAPLEVPIIYIYIYIYIYTYIYIVHWRNGSKSRGATKYTGSNARLGIQALANSGHWTK